MISITAITLMMEAASTCKTSVNLYQTTRCTNPEDSHLHTRRLENLKSHAFTLAYRLAARNVLSEGSLLELDATIAYR
jgi:hypothetical protein